MKLSTVVQYFENFGEIEDIQICLNQRFGYGIVQFKLAESARNVLQKRYHGIAKHVVSVKPANDQPIESDLNRVFRAASAQLTDLDDECLMIIAEHLDELGLCAMAKTSIRFKRFAEQSFSNSKKFDLFALYPCYDKDAPDKAVFKAFSHLITKLKLTCVNYYQDEDKNPIEYLTKYSCDRLKYLVLVLGCSGNCVILDNNTKEELKLIFSRLNHLEFDNNNFLDSQTTKDLLSSCSELVSITAGSTEMYRDIYFPKLQKLQLVLYDSKEEFKTMLASNPSIGKLKFWVTKLTLQALAIITRYLLNLEKLRFFIFHLNMISLAV